MTSANATGPASSAASRSATRRAVGVLRRPLQRPELASLSGLVAAFTVFSIMRPDLFLTRDNGINVASLAAQYGIVAVGVTVLMIAGQFDLSVGTIVGLTGWAMHYFGNVLGLPPIVTILCTLAFGTLLGAINGIIQVRTGLPSFIITLATSLVYRGILTRNTSGFPVVVKFPDSYAQAIAGKQLFGYRMSLLWFLVVAVLATLFLLRTRMGNWAFAIGQNPTAAKNLGVPVSRTTVTLFALSGFTSGIAGVVVAVQYFSIDANRGVGWELIAIAMSVIGGTLLTGGYGSVLGTVLGAFMYAMVTAGLLLIGLQGYWVNIFLGIVVLVAVLINRVVIDRFVMSPDRPGLEQPIILTDETGPPGGTHPSDATTIVDATRRGAGTTPVVALREVTMTFQSVTALRNISIEAHVGKVLALLGDNGAGKSTLIKVLSGVYRPTSGSVEVDGRPVTLHSAHDARAAGISTVFQDLAVCDLMSIVRNMVLGNEPCKRFGPLRIYDARKADRITIDAFAMLGVDLRRRLSDPAATLSGGQKQAVAIARAIVYGSRCLILDEPTAALAVRQTQQVLDQVRRARDAGQAVILIMHNLQQAMSVADEVVVLSRGRVMGQFSSADTDLERVTQLVAQS
ncbi:MAG: ATP-binding cassette domain-containing protein [Verrucomicrobia bacterium]|nr:ATP-binding cassette domain-containing protein [Verrucomicrobiota bacterium]